ncbi:SpoIID/LytB domain-containing protein [Pseudanabaena sp. FACHB-2040]|uniref:SpoIID/LytB domain-containing protein n=1 Tax=Pseudanabaena sp. FACHB-2040 TaxID=2692859 RepID=UPI00168A3074|nr:SpoIID/LytB domain-containing protein [Pseudanabaena sp. FACHB-2040]MBD2259941.1 SpoIID/LytB domain-containing protein [Pseudanabaena sp. FACHB-2040]
MPRLTVSPSSVQKRSSQLRLVRSVQKISFRPFWGGLGLLSLGLIAAQPTPAQTQAPLNPVIQVGVVQRFGEEPTKTLKLEPLPGDQLVLDFTTQGQPETIQTTQVEIVVSPQPLPAPALQERVVLSSHRSFESAEDSAKQWQQRGIETEIAQPRSWEVWAKRDVYSTPLLRRLLLKNIQAQGLSDSYLESQVLAETPKAAFIANGFRYNRDEVSIRSGNQRIRVVEAAGDRVQETRLYGGIMRLQPNTYGTYTLVNDVPIETYLRGVVPHEIGLGAPQTAIEAQAILARTYALRNLRRFAIDNYQLCADTQCQVYWGVGGAAPASDNAIATTQGLVLTYQNELVDALYSSTAGGITSPFSHVWNGPDRPYLQAVVDSVQGSWDLALRPLGDEQNFRAFINLKQGFNEDTWDTFRWQYDSPLPQVNQDIRTYLERRQDPKAAFNQVTGLRVSERAASGRVQAVEVQTDAGTVSLVKDEIVRVLSAPRSLLFYIDPIYQELPPNPNPAPNAAPITPPITGYRFVGGGFGHGVGMSQTGAYRLGNLGWTNDRILQFYFPGTTLQPINPNLVLWRDPEEVQQGG